MPGSDRQFRSRETVSMHFFRSELLQANRIARSCKTDMATDLGGPRLGLCTRGLEFHQDQYNYRSVDIAISPTRRRREHRCVSSSCNPIASATDLVSAGATAHHHTNSHTFPVEGFRLRAFRTTIQCVVNAFVSSCSCPTTHPTHVHAVRPGVGTAVQQRQMIEGRGRRRASRSKCT